MEPVRKICYLYGTESEAFVAQFKEMEESEDISFVLFAEGGGLPELDLETISHIIVSGSISEIKVVLEFALENDLSIGILPLPEQSRFAKILDLP